MRRPLSIIFSVLMLAFIALTKPRHYQDGIYNWIELAGYLLIFGAVLGRTWSVLFIGGRKNRKLCQEGPYANCRNPLYFFSFMGVIGLGLCAQSLPALLITAPVFLVYYGVLIRDEERRLEQIFGEAYREYASQVPRFWPQWRQFHVPKEITVNARSFSRSLRDVSWFLLAIIALQILEVVKTSGFLPILELPW
jgi:protein-S-isoprenylcysteine O-methyltransferase Ste14